MNLSFFELRNANLLRLPLFKNSRGEPAHAKPDGSDWSLGDWGTATAGELGEALNIVKKLRRGDLSLAMAREALADELADTIIYLDLLAFRCSINLDSAVATKFNRKSDEQGIPVRLENGMAVQHKTAPLGSPRPGVAP